MGSERSKIAAAATGVLLIVGLVVAYVATLPQAAPDHRPVMRVAASDPNTDLTAQAQAERNYDQGEHRFAGDAKKAKATDTPVIDVCTGKPIAPGPMRDITNKSRDCPPPPRPKPTQGAYDAVDALNHECSATKRKPGAINAASAYLVNEARTRPTWELEDLLYQASEIELDCYRSMKELNLVDKFLGAMEHVENELRPYNRFLDGVGKKKQRRRKQHLTALRRRLS